MNTPDEILREADPLTQASVLEQHQRDTSINEIRSKLEQRQKPRADGTYEFTDCEDCDQPIGEPRLKLSAMNHLCIYCATRFEERQRMMGKRP